LLREKRRNMIPKLTLRERWMYRRKKFDKLHQLMRRTEEGTTRFNELCVQDANLRSWQGQLQPKIAATIFSSPKLSAEMKKVLKSQGRGKLFDLYKILHKKGFVTIDQAAAAFGITTEEMKTTIDVHPELFKELHISDSRRS
jgi:hypothetical protein